MIWSMGGGITRFFRAGFFFGVLALRAAGFLAFALMAFLAADFLGTGFFALDFLGLALLGLAFLVLAFLPAISRAISASSTFTRATSLDFSAMSVLQDSRPAL